MKRILYMALLSAFAVCVWQACTGCAAAPETAPINPMPQPEVMSEFKVGDNVIITFPDDSTMNGIVMAVGEIKEFDTGRGFIERSRGYTVHVTRTEQIPGPNGELQDFTIVLEAEIPEFALTLQRRPNEKAVNVDIIEPLPRDFIGPPAPGQRHGK